MEKEEKKANEGSYGRKGREEGKEVWWRLRKESNGEA